MQHLQKFNDFIYEAELNPHYLERYDLRVTKLRIIDKDGGNYSVPDAIERIKFMLEHLGIILMEQYTTTKENKLVLINFGDIKIKSNNKLYEPTFAVKADNDNDKIYKGSVFVASVVKNETVTLEIFNRDSSIQEIIKKSGEHLIRKGEINKYESIEHVYLRDKENIINMDISIEEFKNLVNDDKIQKITHINKEPKEMVFAPGTIVRFYDKDNNVIEKAVVRTERQDNGIRIFFEGSFKTFNNGDRFIVTPAKNTAADKDKFDKLGTGENFVGRIFNIGTYNKDKYRGKGAAAGGAADYVRIQATSVF